MDPRRQLYRDLIIKLLDAPSQVETILATRPELIDSGLANEMIVVAEMRAKKGDKNGATRLVNMAEKILTGVQKKARNVPTAKRKADTLLQQGINQYNHSQYPAAIQSWQQSLTIYREIGDRQGKANSLNNLGNAYDSLGQYNRAIELHQQSLAISREIGDRQGEVNSLGNLGSAYDSLGQYNRAIEFHEQQLAISREIGYRRGEAASLGGLGSACYSLGQYQRAIDFHQQQLAISREIGNRQGEAASLGNLGSAYYSLGQYTRAIEFHQQYLAISREIGYRQGEANSLGSLGNAYRSLGQYTRAINFYQQSLAIAREIGDRQGEANSLGNLGIAYSSLGQYNRAIEFHQQKLAIAREIGNIQGEAASLGNLGIAYHSLGQYQRAIDFHEQDLAISREIGDRQGEANSLGSLGNAYLSLGQYSRAIEFHEQSLAIKREIGDRQGEAASLGSLGNAYLSLGQYQQAIEFHEQSLAISREIGDRQGVANSLGSLGNAYLSLGQYQQAIEFHKQYLAIAREIGDRQGEAASLGNLGIAYYSLGQYQRAIEFHEQCLAISGEIGDRHGEAGSLGSLGNAYLSLGQYQRAIDFYQQAIKICPPEDFPIEAFRLGENLGDTACRAQQWETAIQGYELALEAVEERCKWEESEAKKQQLREEALAVYHQMMELCLQVGDLPKAVATLERGKSRNLIEIWQQRHQPPYPKDTPPHIREQLDTLRQEIASKRRWLEVMSGDNPNPTGGGDITPGGRQTPAPTANFSPDVIANIRQQLKTAREQLDQLLREIKKFDPTFALSQRVEQITWPEILSLIDDQTAIVAWYIGRERLYAFVMTQAAGSGRGNPPVVAPEQGSRGAGEQGKPPTLIAPLSKEGGKDSDLIAPLSKGGWGDRSGEQPGNIDLYTSTPEALEKLQNLRKRYVELYQQQDKSPWQQQLEGFLQELADILEIDKLRQLIPPQCQKLILVPYRQLHIFPLHALPLATGGSLLDAFPQGLRYTPSCQLLQVAQASAGKNKPLESAKLFAIQNPTGDLDYADVEVKAIRQYFPQGGEVLENEKATKTAITPQRLRDVEFAHFSCHGYFHFDQPHQSALVLAGGLLPTATNHPPDGSEDRERFIRSPRGDSIDLNHCLTLLELFDLDLRQCRLASLSACETGLTDWDANSDEYIGLDSGILVAGAAGALCSLWAVSDMGTAFLLVKFYQNLVTAPSVSVALQSAQNWLRHEATTAELEKFAQNLPLRPNQKLHLKKWLGKQAPQDKPFSSPYYWGAFCAVGE